MLLCRPFHSSFSVWGSGRGGGDFFLFFPIRERVRVFVCRLETTGEEGEEPLPPSFLPFPLYSIHSGDPKAQIAGREKEGKDGAPTPLSLLLLFFFLQALWYSPERTRSFPSSLFSPCCVAWFSSTRAASVPAWRVLLEWRRGSYRCKGLLIVVTLLRSPPPAVSRSEK